MHIVGRRRGEENRRPGDVFRMPPAACRDALENGLVAGSIRPQRLGIVGFDVTGRNGIDVDALRGPLICQKLASWDTLAPASTTMPQRIDGGRFEWLLRRHTKKPRDDSQLHLRLSCIFL